MIKDNWGEDMEDETGGDDKDCDEELRPPSPDIVMGRGRCNATTSSQSTVRSLITDYFTPRTREKMTTTTTTMGEIVDVTRGRR